MKICSIDGCEEKHMAKGLCPPHYSKWLYYGDPLMEKQTKFCSIKGCNEKHGAKGLCIIHYDRDRKLLYIKKPEVIQRRKEYNQIPEVEKRNEISKKRYSDKPESKKRAKEYRKEYEQIPEVIEKRLKYSQSPKCKEIKKKWSNEHPEKRLESAKKHLEKYGKIFDMTSLEYSYVQRIWSKMVRKDKVCQYCGSDKKVHAHHIFYKNKYPELALNPNNGIPLCTPCHKEFHRLNGR